MRFTYLFFSLLLCLTSYAQPNPINRRAMAIAGLAKSFNPTPCIASYTNPANMPGLAYRWVAIDYTTNSGSGILTDRVQGNNWVQSTPSRCPRRNGNALSFTGTDCWLTTTNVTWTFENNVSFYIIAAITNDLAHDQHFINGSVGNATDLRVYFVQGGDTSYDDANTGVKIVVPNNTIVDWEYAAQASGHDKQGTNGVVVATNTGAPFANTPAFVGKNVNQGIGQVHASIYEMGVFTNTAMTDDYFCSIHYYATNTYGFTP